MFINLQILLFGAAVLTAALIWVLFGFAKGWGLVDRADSDRKIHEGAIPLIGGLAVFICLLLFQLFLPSYPKAISVAMFLLVVVGVIDDRSNLTVASKLLFQCLAVGVITVGANVKIVSLGTLPTGDELLLGYFSIPFTILCAVAMINAVNMIDGIDGLAASLGVLALVYLYFFSVIVGQPIQKQMLIPATVFAGALLGFLIFNLGIIPGKKVFLGDAGSMLIGLVLAYFLTETSQQPTLISALPASMMPWIAAVPILDMAAVTIRRVLRGQLPFRSDRTHLHHRLMNIGYSEREALVLMLILSIVFFLFGILLTQMGGMHAGVGFLLILPVYVVFQSQLGQR